MPLNSRRTATALRMPNQESPVPEITDAKLRSRMQEQLLSLYLRLNGYFVSGLIVHSPTPGENFTEVDLLGIRFPRSREPERQIDSDPLLETSTDLIDLVICE